MGRLIQLTTSNLLGALNLVLVIVCAYVAARVVHNIRRPNPALAAAPVATRPALARAPQARSFSDYQPILDRNLFKSTLVDKEAVKKDTEVPDVVEESPLQAKLIATVVSGRKAKSSATIEDLTVHDRSIYHVKDTLMNEAEIVRIERERVVVRRGGKYEALSLYDQEGKPGAPGAPASKVPFLSNFGRPGVRPMPSGLNTIANFNAQNQQFRVMPSFQAGRINGFRVFALAPGSKWAQAGLRNGDIVRAINGREISSVQQAYEILGQLKGVAGARIEVERGNQRQTITYGGES
jgi:general secretion pathway protein C